MDYLLDSNIVIVYSRNSEMASRIENEYKIFSEENRLAISTISIGEINATIKKLNLGAKRENRRYFKQSQ